MTVSNFKNREKTHWSDVTPTPSLCKSQAFSRRAPLEEFHFLLNELMALKPMDIHFLPHALPLTLFSVHHPSAKTGFFVCVCVGGRNIQCTIKVALSKSKF